MSTPRITLDVDQHIAVVRFNRPEKMNALDMQTFDELLQIQQKIRDNTDIRVVILTAQGDNFCAGLDVQSVMSDPAAVKTLLSKPEGQDWPGNYVQQVVIGWQQLNVPVIAVLQGYVFGGGLQIALGADFRIAHPDSQLSVMEIRWGIIPDMGISALTPSLLARDQLKRLAMTGERITASEAQGLGLVTQTDEQPEEKAVALAQSLSLKNPQAIQGIKQLFQHEGAVTERLALEARLQQQLLFSPNQMEAVQANLQKRSPVFK